jgi:hypothetical protein
MLYMMAFFIAVNNDTLIYFESSIDILKWFNLAIITLDILLEAIKILGNKREC